VALQSGEIDVLIRTATANMTRDVELGLDFITPYFYDGQTFIVRGEANITRLEDLDGATIAVLTGTTTEMNLAAVMASRKLKYTPITFENLDEIKNAFVAGRADAVSFDKSRAMVFLTQYGAEGNFKGLDETISKEPLALAVRHGDNNWKDICQWMLYALFFGEEHGINSTNIDSIKANTSDPEVKNFFGTSFGVGSMLGLDNDWTYQVIKQVGNYGELFDKHLGIPMKVTRGLNKPWTEGGLLYAHPFN
jgi:general L-amino acid transport system substrate-binding protein